MEDDSGDKALAAVRGLWLSGARESAVYCGVEAQSLPTVRLQARFPSVHVELTMPTFLGYLLMAAF